MKTKLISIIALLAIITVGFIACNNDNDTASHTHEWGAWTVTTPATCTTAGEEIRVCSLDASHTETRAIPIDPTAHDWGEWTQTKAPTPTETGEETRTCKLDATHTETQVVAKLDNITLHDQIATITLVFKKNGATDNDPYLTATVKGNMTDAQWYGVADTIAKLINDDFKLMKTESDKNWYRTLFARGIIYIVEPNPKGYTHVRLIGDGKTIYIALSNVGIWKWVVNSLADIWNYRTGVAKAIDNSGNAVRIG
jgi:hypothetical protein